MPAPRISVSAVLLGAVLGFAACGAAYAGRDSLVAVLWVLQALLVLAWLAFLGVPGRPLGLVIGAGAALAADLLLARQAPNVLGALAGVLGLAFVGEVIVLLAWRHRTRVTDTLAAQTSGVVLACGAACFVALRHAERGRDGAVAGLLALAFGGIAGRLAWLAVRRSDVGAVSAGLVCWVAVGA
ncbi:MAG TPA: hypothetical protein VHC41_07760, partial [Mycobacteriales bacterium]|nr:hypothetical protein [Mycobacteriales bacterium]